MQYLRSGGKLVVLFSRKVGDDVHETAVYTLNGMTWRHDRKTGDCTKQYADAGHEHELHTELDRLITSLKFVSAPRGRLASRFLPDLLLTFA